MRKELLFSKLKEIKNSVHYVKEFLPSDSKYLQNRKDKNALYKEVEYVIQLMLDVCAIVNTDIIKESPNDEDGIIESLMKKNIISNNLSKRIHEMKRFRNVLVHKYGDVDDKMAYESIKNGTKDIDLFIEEFEKFLKK